MEKKEEQKQKSEILEKNFREFVSNIRTKREGKLRELINSKLPDWYNKVAMINIGNDLDLKNKIKEFEDMKNTKWQTKNEEFESRQKKVFEGKSDPGLDFEQRDLKYWNLDKEEELQQIIEEFKDTQTEELRKEYYKWEKIHIEQFDKDNKDLDDKNNSEVQQKWNEFIQQKNIEADKRREEYIKAENERRQIFTDNQIIQENKERAARLEQKQKDKEEANKKAKEAADKKAKEDTDKKAKEETIKKSKKETINKKLPIIYDYYEYIFKELNEHLKKTNINIRLIDLIRLYISHNNIPNIYTQAYCKILSKIEKCVQRLVCDNTDKIHINPDKKLQYIEIKEFEYQENFNMQFSLVDKIINICIFKKDISHIKFDNLKYMEKHIENSKEEQKRISATYNKIIADEKKAYMAPKMTDITREYIRPIPIDLTRLMQIIYTYAINNKQNSHILKINMSNIFFDKNNFNRLLNEVKTPIFREKAPLHIQKINVAPINLSFIFTNQIQNILNAQAHFAIIAEEEEEEEEKILDIPHELITNITYEEATSILEITFTNTANDFINEYTERILSDMHIDRKFDETGLIYYYLPCDKEVQPKDRLEAKETVKAYCTYKQPHMFTIIWDPIYRKEYYRTTTLDDINGKKQGYTTYYIKKINIDYNYEFAGAFKPSFIEYKSKYSPQIEAKKELIDYSDDNKLEEASKQFYVFETPKHRRLIPVNKGFPISMLQDKDSFKFMQEKKNNPTIQP